MRFAVVFYHATISACICHVKEKQSLEAAFYVLTNLWILTTGTDMSTQNKGNLKDLNFCTNTK
jgi:hypothetical protein